MTKTATQAFEVIAIPYRDLYFAYKYGWAVRDLAIIRALQKVPEIRRIVIVNRPVSIYERILGKTRSKITGLSTAKIVDRTSFDCVGPLQGRAWTRIAYNQYAQPLEEKRGGVKRIIVDFTPIAEINYDQYDPDLVWYDLIDNFTKHNRFSERERSLVRDKYLRVSTQADLITGVTERALEEVKGATRLLLPNGLAQSDEPMDEGIAKFDLGFIGFVTNKFDVDLVRTLATQGKFSIVIHGEVYDRSLAKKLEAIPNLRLAGAFNADATEKIISSFNIGLIPYQASLSHDGSPLKLYQYLARGRQVISSHAYAGETDRYKEWVAIAEDMNQAALLSKVSSMLLRARSGGAAFRRRISVSLSRDVFWSDKIGRVINALSGNV